MQSNEIRAQKGVPMALMDGDGSPCQWDGAALRDSYGCEMQRTGPLWLAGGINLYTRPEGVRVLPQLDEPEPAIEVGSLWRARRGSRLLYKVLRVDEELGRIVLREDGDTENTHISPSNFHELFEFVAPPTPEPEPVEAVTVGCAVEPPKPDTKALLVAKAIADLELVKAEADKLKKKRLDEQEYQSAADIRDVVLGIGRVLETLKEATND